MEEAIIDFAKQLKWEPKLENADQAAKADPAGKFILAGMGGSHLAAGLLKLANPKLDLLIHRDYGLPRVPDYFLKEALFIASSYSGNTEETVDAFKVAHEAGLQAVIITTGGSLLELAKSTNTPYIQIPATGIQPRAALGYFCRALTLVIGDTTAYELLGTLAHELKPKDWQEEGEILANKLTGRVPLVYSSTINLPLAYNWKIKLNETGKLPAFYNVFPELNHNEMTGFDVGEHAIGLKLPFAVVILHDEADDHRVHKRQDITADLYADRGIPVEIVDVEGESIWHKIFSTLLLADWTAVALAAEYNAEAEQVPMVEEFKKLMAE
jgi:glucose/mannose-6-phosphate isomerase